MNVRVAFFGFAVASRDKPATSCRTMRAANPDDKKTTACLWGDSVGGVWCFAASLHRLGQVFARLGHRKSHGLVNFFTSAVLTTRYGVIS